MEKNITNQTRHNNTNNYRENIDKYRSIIDIIYIYYYIVVVSFGIVGNLISLFIFTRPNLNKKTNTGILYTLLCVFNLLIFFEETFLDGGYSLLLFNYKISFYFKTINMELIINSILIEILSWIQVLISFDRFILVIYPMKAHIMRKKVSSNNHKNKYLN